MITFSFPFFSQAVITGSGSGYQGFYLAYFQNSCWNILSKLLLKKTLTKILLKKYFQNSCWKYIFKTLAEIYLQNPCWNILSNPLLKYTFKPHAETNTFKTLSCLFWNLSLSINILLPNLLNRGRWFVWCVCTLMCFDIAYMGAEAI